MNVLVVAAHPDDEVLGCGGAIARLAEAGHRVRVVILGEGQTSRAESRTIGLAAGGVSAQARALYLEYLLSNSTIGIGQNSLSFYSTLHLAVS